MAIVGTSYQLRHFGDSADPDLPAALLLYVRNVPASARTDTREIVYWLDHCSLRQDWAFHVFGFYRNRELVGYAQAAYFLEARLLVIDYIAIDERNRQNNVFFEFVAHLKQFLEEVHPEYCFAVAEVCYGPGQEYPSPESRLLIRLLKIQGFRVVRATYYQPRMILADPESEMRADLLVYSSSHFDSIHTETYLKLIQTIYYKHYLPWQSITVDSSDAYRKHLDRLYSLIKARVGRRRSIPVNGHKVILARPETREITTPRDITVFSVQALGIVMAVTLLMIVLKYEFNLSNASLAAYYGMAIASFLAVTGIVSRNARAVFAELVKIAKHFCVRPSFPQAVNGKHHSASEDKHDRRRSSHPQ